MTTKKFGYIRLDHTNEVVENECRRKLEKEECLEIYIDRNTPARGLRPELERLKVVVKPGDILAVGSLSDLGRSLDEIITTAADFIKKKIGLRVITGNISASGIGKITVDTLITELAYNAREIKEHRLGNIRAKRSSAMGRPKALKVSEIREIQERRDKGVSGPRLAAVYGVSKATIYRAFNLSDKDLSVRQAEETKAAAGRLVNKSNFKKS